MPLLVDVNVYYRILKLLYHKQVLPLNFGALCIAIPWYSGSGMRMHTV